MTNTPVYISDKEIESLISFKDAIDITEQAFCEYTNKESLMPNKIYLDLPQYNGDFRAMPAYSKHYNLAGVKWVNSHPDNCKLNLPSVTATMLVNNPETAQLLAILEAKSITNLRTGAAGALSVKYLCSKQHINIACIGCGIQAYHQIACIREVVSINQLHICDTSLKRQDQFISSTKDILEEQTHVIKYDSVESCIQGVDVIITTTPSVNPLIMKPWLPKPVLINAIGADAKGKQELDSSIIKDATLIVDDIDQACHSGEVNVPIANQIISHQNIYATIGEIITGKKPIKDSDITVFDSTGLAIQDIALAGYAIKQKGLK